MADPWDVPARRPRELVAASAATALCLDEELPDETEGPTSGARLQAQP